MSEVCKEKAGFMIVQELKKIQERVGWLPPDEMRALATRLNVPQHRVHEVASFYPLYRLSPPPFCEVKVCRDMACHLHGAPAFMRNLQAFGAELGGKDVHVEGVSCLGQCDQAIAVTINDHHVYRGLNEKVVGAHMRTALAGKPMPHQHVDNSPLGWKIDPYDGKPRWDALKAFVADRNVEGLLAKLESANLRGMGGAGFPTFRKWAA
ncbi:MAG: NAD(P)H-dependent oxidoreductase subunit E, partial [Candidatus Acidiferrum sp.]